MRPPGAQDGFTSDLIDLVCAQPGSAPATIMTLSVHERPNDRLLLEDPYAKLALLASAQKESTAP
jgi:hypothetical protein